MLLSKLQGNFTKGWRIVFEDPTQRKEDLLPDFIKGERTTPTLVLEKTKAPNQFTEALITCHGNRRKTGGR
jgi:hypothetical protein